MSGRVIAACMPDSALSHRSTPAVIDTSSGRTSSPPKAVSPAPTIWASPRARVAAPPPDASSRKTAVNVAITAGTRHCVARRKPAAYALGRVLADSGRESSRASLRRRSTCFGRAPGLVAQRESVRLTRGRSLVRSQSGPPPIPAAQTPNLELDRLQSDSSPGSIGPKIRVKVVSDPTFRSPPSV